MESRQKQLVDLKCYLQSVDTEVTMILQSLQWDRKSLLEGTSKATCQYDTNHKVPSGTLKVHEDSCRLKKLGYSGKDEMLPGPLDENALSLVKFCTTDIQEIISNAAQKDPLFKRVCVDPKSVTAERQQAAYTTDERRAIYDAVVRAAPTRNEFNELALPSSSEESQKGPGAKTRLEILAELRDMKRRRTKYRVAAKTKNYSDVLRDVIKTQMEVYSEVNAETPSTTAHVVSKDSSSTKDDRQFISISNHNNDNDTKLDDSYSREKHKIHRLDSSRERHGETRTSSESRRRRDYEDKYRENKKGERERRHTSEKDKYYNTDGDRRKPSHEKEYRNKYDHGREAQKRSSKDKSEHERSHSKHERSYRDRANKKYDEDRRHKHKLDKDEKYTRYYDVQYEEKRKRYK